MSLLAWTTGSWRNDAWIDGAWVGMPGEPDTGTTASFEADLNAHLLSSSELVALVGTFASLACIWPNMRPEGSDVPAVVTQVIYTGPATVLDGSDGDLLNKRVQIDCWANSYDEARDLAEAVRARMKIAAASFASVMLSDQDFFEPETKLYRVSMDFSCWYDVP